jgi:hypothetical protein
MPSIRAAPARPDASVVGGLGPEAVSALARQHTRAALEMLGAALTDPDVGTRITAAEQLLAIGYGEPVQPLAIDAHGLHVEAHGLDTPGARQNGEDEPSGWKLFRDGDC